MTDESAPDSSSTAAAAAAAAPPPETVAPEPTPANPPPPPSLDAEAAEAVPSLPAEFSVAGSAIEAERDVGLERVIFFSDAVFAIAITLLVLDISVPDIPAKLVASQLAGQLRDLWPRLFSFALSFAIIAAFWTAHHRTFGYIRRYDRQLIRINFLLLFFVALLPFPTSLVGRYGSARIAVVLYAAAIAACGLCSWFLWWYATSDKRLVDPELDDRLIADGSLRAIVPVVIFSASIVIAFFSVRLAEFSWIASAIVQPLVLRRMRSEDSPAR